MAKLSISIISASIISACALAASTAEADSLKRACMSNDTKACIALGDAYARNIEHPDAPAFAARHYAAACEGGSSRGCFKLGKLFASKKKLRLWSLLDRSVRDRIGPADAVAAINVSSDRVTDTALSRQCAAGRMEDCLNLGHLLRSGIEVRQDFAGAVSLYTKACQGHVNRGCFSLGQMFHHGWGIDKDASNALRVYAKACGSGDKPGCFGLGRILSGGRSMDRDMAYRVRMSRLACDKGQIPACPGYRQ